MESTEIKIGLFGTGGCGKTALAQAYTRNGFLTEDYLSQIMDGFVKKTVIDGKNVNLKIDDTAGQDDFREMRGRYFHNCDVFIFVYSLVDPASLPGTEEIWRDALSHTGQSRLKCVLVGNFLHMCDDEENRNHLVRDEDAEKLAQMMQCKHIKVSIAKDVGINEIFETAARLFLYDFDNPKPSKPQKKGFFSRLFGKSKKK